MDYFTDVYLKQLNKHGKTIQQRIHGEMECDFENKLKKSVNKVFLYNEKDDVKYFEEGIVADKKVEQEEIIYYLCTRIGCKLTNGQVLWIPSASEDKAPWMVFFKEQYQTIGYNRYRMVLLENYFTWVGEDGIVRNSYGRLLKKTDQTIKNQFTVNNEVAVYTPHRTLQLVLPRDNSLKRGIKFNIEDTTWKIGGIDKESVPGLMYITLEEDYFQSLDSSLEEKLKDWSIFSSQGDEIVLQKNQYAPLNFYASYKGVITEEPLNIHLPREFYGKELGKNNFEIMSQEIGEYDILVDLANSSMTNKTFKVLVTEAQENWLAISGPSTIRVGEVLKFTLNTSLSDYEVEILSENDNFIIDKIENNEVYLKGNNIGKDNIVLKYNNVTYKTPINVISMWM